MFRSITTQLLNLILFTILLNGSALAENRVGAFTLSPMAGYHVIDGGMELDDGVIYDLAAGYNLNQNWAIEAGVGFTPTETDGADPVDIDIWTLSLGALYHFHPGKALNPYLSIGGGGLIYDVDSSNDDEDFMLYWGTGLKYAVTEDVALRLDLRHILDYRSSGDLGEQSQDDEDWRHQFQAMAGLTFQFGGTSSYPVYQEKKVDPVAKDRHAPMPVAAPMDGDKDGVIDSQDQCPGTGPGVRVDEKGCPVEAEPIATMVIQLKFGVDSADINPFHYRELEKVAAFIAQYPDAKIQVIGHTDSQGDADYNLALSQHRAENVRTTLIEKYGVNADRITAIGMGEKKPVASNETVEGRSDNRRVEIDILP